MLQFVNAALQHLLPGFQFFDLFLRFEIVVRKIQGQHDLLHLRFLAQEARGAAQFGPLAVHVGRHALQIRLILVAAQAVHLAHQIHIRKNLVCHKTPPAVSLT